MKILVLSDLWLPFPGGAERYIANVTDALVARGHEVHILTSYAKAKSALPMTIADIGVYERHEQGADLLSTAIHCLWGDEGCSLDDMYHWDCVLSHHFFMGEFPDVFAASFIPFIEIIHNRQRHPDAAFAIFNSQYTADRCGFREGDIVMLPPASPRVKFDRALAFPPPEYIGHIKPLGGKGIALTYQLAAIMPERKFLVLRGEWQDGEDIRRLPNVEFMEPCDDIREFYSRCRVVLMPSLSEDAGTVPQECALNGIPCISSNVGGLPETNAGGVVLPPDDVYSWVTEVCKLDHPEQYKQIVESQRKHIASLRWEEKFDEIDRRVRECAK